MTFKRERVRQELLKRGFKVEELPFKKPSQAGPGPHDIQCAQDLVVENNHVVFRPRKKR
jgi:hypothetical protein